jgi:hypothetical protein
MPSFFQLGMNGPSPADGWPPYPVDSPNLFSRTDKKRLKIVLLLQKTKKNINRPALFKPRITLKNLEQLF